MGVTKLWSILFDACEKDTDVTSLHHQTVAVDLSSWICELKKVQISQKIPHLYIKNLFHRTTYLLKNGIKLVFVEDGTAPDIKKAALSKRSSGVEKTVDRIGLKKLSQQCRELLTHLGIPCIESHGEAEALCAKLNSEGIVDAVLTSDGDTLLYGAKKVYRNLKLDTGTVDCYDMEKIGTKLVLGRRDLVTLALLCGCDYQQEGVYSVGVQKAKEFIQLCHKLELDPLSRIMNWRANTELNNLQTIKDSPQKKLSHCALCKHLGTKAEHFRNGCRPCDTEQSCDQDSSVKCDCNWCSIELNKFELSMREKALKYEGFPDKNVIEEYLNFSGNKILPELKWSPIEVSRLKTFVQGHWYWTDVEFFNKISELLVMLQVNGMDWAVSNKLQPYRVVRKSIMKKKQCVIVEWKRLDVDTETKEHLAITVPEENFRKLYPDIMKEFQKEKEEEKQQKITDRKRKAKHQAQLKKGQKTITDYFRITKKAKRSPSPQVEACSSGIIEQDSVETDCIVIE